MKIKFRAINLSRCYLLATVAVIGTAIFAFVQCMVPAPASHRMEVAQLRDYIPSSYLYPDGCPILQIVNVRGTALGGDHGATDTTTKDFSGDFTKLAEGIPNLPQPIYIPYDTPTANTYYHLNLPSTAYDLYSGISSTQKYLLPMLRKCPTTVFVLDGYSFGAWITKNVYNQLSNVQRKNILLVAFGDPTFDPFQSSDDAGTYNRWLPGLVEISSYAGSYTVPAGRNGPYYGYTGPQVLDTCPQRRSGLPEHPYF